ncbi:hypothetical protein WA158_000892 [Blastocystis sp. Blastoise]
MRFLLFILCFMLGDALNCVSPQVLVTFNRKYASWPYEEYFYIYEGFDSDGLLIDTVFGENDSLGKHEYCLNPVIHTIIAKDTYGDNWATGSSLTVIIDSITLLYNTVEKGNFAKWIIYTSYLISKSSKWKYSTISQNNISWIFNSDISNSWSSYSQGSFPSIINDSTRYYLTTITIPDLSNFAAFELGVYSKEGIIVYINGQELLRRNLPNGIITSSTLATKEDTQYMYRRIIQSIQTYFGSSSQVTIAIEIHPKDIITAHNDLFDVFLLPLYGSCSPRTHEAIVSSIPIRTDNTDNDKAFDNRIGSATSITTLPFSLLYQFNDDRREWINKYEITSYTNNQKNDPKEFTLSGSNDNGNTWTLLDIKAHVIFSSRSETKPFLLPSNSIAYNMYKIEVTSVFGDENTLNLAEIEFYACHHDIITDFIYKKSSYTFYKNIDDVYIAPYSSGFKDFTLLSPATLPSGLLFIPSSGEIYGIPRTNYRGWFIISAMNAVTQQVMNTTFLINIIECDGVNNIHLRLIKYNNNQTPYSEIITLYDSNNNIQFNTVGVTTTEQTYDICLPVDIYTLELKNTLSDIWDLSSLLTIILYNKYDTYTIFKGSLRDNSISKTLINLHYSIPPHNPNVLCYTHSMLLPTNWYTIDYIPDENWNPCLEPETRLTTTSRVQFFRHTFNVTSIINMHIVEIRLKSVKSTVIYLNNKKVYKYGLPNENITINTIPTITSTNTILHLITIDINTINIGINTISIAQVYSNTITTPIEISFDFSLRLDGSSDFHSQTLETTCEGLSEASDSSSYLIDYSYTSRWFYNSFTSSNRPLSLTLTYNNDAQFSYINQYCFISNYNNIFADPKEWTVYGCIKNTCTLLGSESNIKWSARTQRQCFFMNSHTESYQSYQFRIMKNSGDDVSKYIALAEIELFAINFNSIVTNPPYYNPNIINGFVDTYIYSVSHGSNYHKYSIINGTLPNGLYIDSNSGTIYGIPTSASTLTMYTIEAYNLQEETSFTTLSLSISYCSYPNILYYIKIDNPASNGGSQMSFQLYESITNTLIDSQRYFPDFSIMYYRYCSLISTYKLVLFDDKRNGWGSTTLSVHYSYNTQIISTSFSSGLTNTVSFTLQINPNLSMIWNNLVYFNIPDPTDASWSTIGYDATGWSAGPYSVLSATGSITQYYRAVFSISDINIHNSFALTMYIYGGAVVYINGFELDRYYMPFGLITPETLSTSYESTLLTYSKWFYLYITENHLVTGFNVLAIEMHKNHIDVVHILKGAYLTFSSNDINEIQHGYSDGENDNPSPDGKITKVYDQLLNTKWFSPNKCVGAWFSWTYNNNVREPVNSYSIRSSNDCNSRHPSAWRLEGSNDKGANWDRLHTASNEKFTYYLQKKEFSFIPTKAYNRYRITFTSCSNTNFPGETTQCDTGNLQLSEITLDYKKANYLCSPIDGYPPSNSGSYAFIPCNDGTSNKKHRRCYNNRFLAEDVSFCRTKPHLDYNSDYYSFFTGTPIPQITTSITNFTSVFCTSSPSLPIGLHLDSLTCYISGTPLIPQSYNNYIINAKVNDGFISTEINLAIYKSEIVITSEITFHVEDSISFIMKSPLNLVPEVIGDPVSSWMITPSLPLGVTIDIFSGIISGIPLQYMFPTLFIISATPIGLSIPVTTNLTMEILPLQCPSDNVWPVTNSSTTAISSCNNPQKEGQITRLCNNIGIWENEVEECTYIIPSIIFDPNIYIIYINEQINIIPITQQYVSSWSITPSLPVGLTINNNGIITGISINYQNSTEYIIEATNPSGSGQAILFLTIYSHTCPSDGIWPITNSSTTAISSCYDPQKEGQITRLCNIMGIWENVVEECTYIIPSIIFDPNIYIIYINEQIAITPITQQYVSSWSITPSLPVGLTINNNGMISGSPILIQNSITYTIIATNPSGSGQATLSIAIYSHTCPSDGIWPITNSSTTVTFPCNDPQKEGQITRFCNIMGIWENKNEECTYIIPSIEINPSSIILYINESVILSPITQQYVSSWSITPSLPVGLTINAIIGIITGIPAIIQASRNYTIIATNPSGSGQASLSITINSHICPSDGIWPITNSGSTSTFSCSDPLKEGQIIRECTDIGVWNSVIDSCIYKAPIIDIDPLYYTIFKEEPIEILPIVINKVDSWTIAPLLPEGLTMSQSSGIITGSPLVLQSATQYILTASNSDTYSSIMISISIVSRTCDYEKKWPVTDVGTTAYLFCENSNVSTQSRDCIHINTIGQWKPIDTTTCYTLSKDDKPTQGQSFIQFYLRFSGIVSQFFDAPKVHFFQKNLNDYLTSLNNPNSKVYIESIDSSSSSSFLEENSIVKIRIVCDEANSLFIRDSYINYIKNTLLSSLQSISSEYNKITSITLSPNDITLTNYSIWNDTTFITIISSVIAIILIIIIIVIVIMIKSKKTTKIQNTSQVDKKIRMHSNRRNSTDTQTKVDTKATVDTKTIEAAKI